MRNDLRAWHLAALPCLAVLGVALPLTFASHCDQFLYDFHAIDLLPLYATAFVVLAAVAIPFWIAATAGLMAVEAMRRPPGPQIAAALRAILLALTAVILAATLIRCLRTWLGTFGDGLPLSANAALAVAVAIAAIAVATRPGRSALRAIAPVAAVCAAAGLLSLASLPVFGWQRDAAMEASLPDAGAATAPAQGSDPGQALPVATSTVLPGNGSRPNIVLLTIDALSAPHMSLYGYARPTTPQLQQFARGALVFDRAYANGNFTTPGIATLLTGTLPWTHRALQLPVWPLNRTRTTSLPAVLERAGYRTGYVSTNAIAGAAKQGFAAYFQFARPDRTGHVTLCADELSKYLRYVCAAEELPPLEEMEGIAAQFRPANDNLEHDPRLALQPALHWLATADRSRPLFLWVHLFPPHSPYAVPKPWLGRFDASRRDRNAASTQPSWAWIQSQLPQIQVHTLEARYDEAVAYADAYVGPFLQRALETLGPNTVIVVTADHGESFAHGYGAHTGPGLYNEIVHIPLIIKLPGETSGSRCDAPAQQADIAPTLAALAGVAAPADWEGQSLIGACAGGLDSAPQRAIFSMNFEQNPRFAALKTGSVAVVEGRWKLIHYMGALHYPYMPPLHDELYDVVSDPHERHNLASRQPAVVQRLLGLIEAALAQHGGRVVHGRHSAPPLPEQSASISTPNMSGSLAAGTP
ncbi:MAG: sulfatase [Gammaproteobacteria bacterium]|nr:sulfatase [Gammaproteobacteria bacterium]